MAARLLLDHRPFSFEAKSVAQDTRLSVADSITVCLLRQSRAFNNMTKGALQQQHGSCFIDHVSGRNRLVQLGRCLVSRTRPWIAALQVQNARHSSSALPRSQLIVSESLRHGFSRFVTGCSSSQYHSDDESNSARTRTSADSEPSEKNAELVKEPWTMPRSDGIKIISSISSGSASKSLFPGMKSIHPMAIVHPDAIIGEGVVIGPFCTVGPGVKLGNNCTLHPNTHICGNTELGERCVAQTGAVVGADIPGQTVIGNDNTIGYYSVVGVKCQDMKYKEGDTCFLYIGHNNDIREFVSIHRSSKSGDQTVIGNRNLIMGSCHVAHDCKLGNENILANGTLLGGHVIFEDFVHTGGAVAVHQFCHIDSYSFLAGGSMVTRDVPMYMMVAGDRAELRGLNLEGLRRNGFSNEEVKSIRRAYQKLFMNSDPEAGGLEDRLAKLESDEDMMKVPAVLAMLKSVHNCFGENRRGICHFRHWTSV